MSLVPQEDGGYTLESQATGPEKLARVFTLGLAFVVAPVSVWQTR